MKRLKPLQEYTHTSRILKEEKRVEKTTLKIMQIKKEVIKWRKT